MEADPVGVPPPIEVLIVRKLFHGVMAGRDLGLGLFEELRHFSLGDGTCEVPRVRVRLARPRVHDLVGLEVEVAVSDAVFLHVFRGNERPGQFEKRIEEGAHKVREGGVPLGGGLMTHGYLLVPLLFGC